ncbi:MAG: NAD-dependent epimerase/dehydratase family protein [Candidatus Roseilinea sp.]|uniref:NAD-dependent epimerase/dehydratase family protein n=1 Tax=Candidatus Roseilinea sp. TaxID=2838777 RepID=UPI00404A822A
MPTRNPQPSTPKPHRFLVTGALGCIGAWVVRNLVREGTPVAVLDLASNPHRMRLILSDEELARVQFIAGDITDLGTVEAAFKDSAATHVIHLAGLQVPFCKADPPLGARASTWWARSISLRQPNAPASSAWSMPAALPCMA